MGLAVAIAVTTLVRRAAGAPVTWGAFLLLVYGATLAPSVTLWDSGEFLAAARTLGIPHPPGTPLFILLAAVWGRLLAMLPFAVAVNAASAVATAASCALLGALVRRWTASRLAGALGALAAGTMAAVWQSATETEVYAYSLLLVVLALVAADRAGAQWSERHRLAVAYCFALAVPLHLSVLVAAPAIVYLAATDAGGSTSWRAALAPAGAFLVATGIGTVALAPIVAGGAVLIAGSMLAPSTAAAPGRRSVALFAVLLLGASAVLFMFVRARLDPAVNQGDPSTWEALLRVIGRRQYDVPPLWPRRAPLWLQVGNVVQYADWQVASALDDWPGASWRRTPFTLLFVALGALGSAWHRRTDRRSWRAVALLFGSASLGVVLVLNLRAGPSYGWGILAADALREARERDYFFVLAFAIWGVWSGCGAAALARGRGGALATLAFVPLLLNWRAVDRRTAPDARFAEAIGDALLQSVPRDAVLVVGGDNDTYPVWFVQRVLGVRPDVTPVTVPLLAADWYREEMRRRHGLLSSDFVHDWRGERETVRAIAAAATARGRPVAASVSLLAVQREWMGSAWRLSGVAYTRGDFGERLSIDSVETARVAARIRERLGPPSDRGPREAAARYVGGLLQCPSLALARGAGATAPLLESTCNYR